MLHRNVLMADIDVDQWRNAQYLILDSAKQKARIVVIHDRGHVVKVRHSQGHQVTGAPTRVTDAQQVARDLYQANQGVDFVAVFERDAFDRYFAAVQDSWDIDGDLDEFVTRTYAYLDDFPDGIVTHPGPARSVLGLQWRLGASHDEVEAAVQRYVSPASSVVLGVVDDRRLWSSLVLHFDDDLKIDSITTADPSRVDIGGELAELAERMVGWVEATSGRVSLSVFLDLDGAQRLLASVDKIDVLRRLATEDRLVLGGFTSTLADEIGSR